MAHFLEAWIDPSERQQFKALRPWDHEYHPHVTLVRPFMPRGNEEQIQKCIVEVCTRTEPITMVAEGRGAFGRIQYIPIVSKTLYAFADALEIAIAPMVDLVPKLGEERVLHLTIGRGKPIEPYPRTELHMSQLTAIRNGRIWFAVDLHNHKVLTREEVLARW